MKIKNNQVTVTERKYERKKACALQISDTS